MDISDFYWDIFVKELVYAFTENTLTAKLAQKVCLSQLTII